MDGSCQHPLSGAALATQKDCRLGGSRLERQGESLLHAWHTCLQVGFRNNRADLLFEFLDMRLQSTQLRDAIQHESDLGRCERLRQEIDCTTAHGLDRRLDGRIRGDRDDRQAGSQPQERRQDVQPVFLSQPQIEKDDVKQRVPHKLLSLGAVAGFGHAMVHRLQSQPERLPQALLVVDQQNIHAQAPTDRLTTAMVTN